MIEYTYTVHSDFLFNLQPWAFQGRYPCLWSEYKADIPAIFEYVVKKRGSFPYAINTTTSRKERYTITNYERAGPATMFDVLVNTIHVHWAMKQVPAVKEEKYVASPGNRKAQISFQLAAYNWPDQPRKPVISTWPEAVTRLLQDGSFGAGLDDRNNWLSEPLEQTLAGAATPLEKTERIYKFERDHFSCTRHTALYREKSLKDIFEKRSGNVAEINILLVAMLRHEGLTADPVILSTRDNGAALAEYPILEDYNYVVCRTLVDGRQYYLDASRSDFGFGKLPASCYNGYARVVNNTSPLAVNLSADSLQETQITMVSIVPDDKDSTLLKGSYDSKHGYYGSVAIREAIRDHGQADFFKKARADYPMDVSISQPDVTPLADKDAPVKVSYTFTFDKPGGKVLYINPMMGEALRENLFSAATRLYPVEMPYADADIYNFDLTIPPGYEVEELPAATRVSFNEREGTFNYLTDVVGGHIRISSQLIMRKATFEPEDYENLRSFFGMIVKKQAEQIVLKKKS